MLIKDRATAERLAKSICEDICLYNGDNLKNGPEMFSQINEGRQLFRSRVLPEYYTIFENALSQSELAQIGGAAPLPFRDLPVVGHRLVAEKSPVQAMSLPLLFVILVVVVALVLFALRLPVVVNVLGILSIMRLRDR